jgi:hypothetical protein
VSPPVPAGGRSISAREEFRSKQWASDRTNLPGDKRVFNKRVSLKQHGAYAREIE